MTVKRMVKVWLGAEAEGAGTHPGWPPLWADAAFAFRPPLCPCSLLPVTMQISLLSSHREALLPVGCWARFSSWCWESFRSINASPTPHWSWFPGFSALALNVELEIILQNGIWGARVSRLCGPSCYSFFTPTSPSCKVRPARALVEQWSWDQCITYKV